MNKDKTKDGAEARVIRLFVSSTFRDMQAERDELVKFIFPQLRKLCEQRGVTWGEVDLRWGITDEQNSEGKVLPICLDEIQRCRPFFIGLLGERYGWIPDEIPAEMIAREPWLAEHLDHSVTELEILHGVLNDPGMEEHAYFYFRDPKYLDTLSPEQRADFLESDSPPRRRKLTDLKQRIRDSGFPVHEDFPHPKELGQLVLQDLTALIDQLYPEGSQPDPLELEAAGHEIFALSRAQVYIGRQSYYNQLDAHAHSEEQPLVILGESGSGKSALLTNWAIKYREKYPGDLVLMHFIGATPGSADWTAMLRRILEEFKLKFDIQEEIPDHPEALRSAFANWLNMASARGRVVLILDGLNQLEDHDGAPDLVWLPPHIPGSVRMLLSTLPGRSLDELQKREWPVLTVEPLQPGERRLLIQEYLMRFTKTLSPAHTELIARANQCRNPLFLRVLLDELRLFGVHERLGEQIEHYLKALSIPALYVLILERCEQDYERERPGLVGKALSLLWAARRGLSEAELMDLLGADGQPLPRLLWSPLYLALEQSLLSRGGLIGFFHEYLRQAVQERYLPDQDVQESAHLHLANYFQSQSGQSPRLLDELLWQLVQAKEWRRLYSLLVNLEFFGIAWEFNPFEVKACWAQVEADSSFRMLDAYRQVIDHPDQHLDHARRISFLLSDTGCIEEALSLRAYLVAHYRRENDQTHLQASLGDQANIFFIRGNMDEAMALFQEQEFICRALGDKAGLARSIGNQALNLYSRGDLDEAMRLYKEQERICRELGDKAGLGRSLGNQALSLYARGDLDKAMQLYKEEERICRSLGDKAGLGRSLNNQAEILFARGNLEESMELHKKQEHICRQLGDKNGLGRSLNNQANILYTRGDLDGALALYKEVEHICRLMGDKALLGALLGNQAVIHYSRGDLDQAMRLFKEQEHIFGALGDKNGLQFSLGGQAGIFYTRGDLDGAMALFKEQEQICRRLGIKAALQTSLNSQANILYTRGDLDGAMALFKEQEYICRELGSKAALQASLGGQANILYSLGNLDESMRLHKEEERICRELGDKAGIGASVGGQANILYARGDLDEALVLHKEQEHICRELGIMAGLQASLNNQANILYSRGNLNGAMVLYREVERTCRKVGDKAGQQISLGNQAVIFKVCGDLDEAMRLSMEQERICHELGDKAGLGLSLSNQANILSARGDLDGALALNKQEERIYHELGDPQGLAISLINQAVTMAKKGKKRDAHRLAKESIRLTQENGYRSLAQEIKSIMDNL